MNKDITLEGLIDLIEVLYETDSDLVRDHILELLQEYVDEGESLPQGERRSA